MSKTEMVEYKGVEVEIEVIGCDPRTAYVVNADREVGITLHNLATDEPCFCINKEEIMEFIKSSDRNRAYHVSFTHCIRQIEKGVIDSFYRYYRNKFELDWAKRDISRGLTCAWSK